MHNISFVLGILMREGGVLLPSESPNSVRPSTKPTWIVPVGRVADLCFKCVGLRVELRASVRGHTVNSTQSSA